MPIGKIETSQHKELMDPVLNSVVALAVETARSGYGALVFSSSRAMCESDALLISRAMALPAELNPAALDRRSDLLSDLRSLDVGLDRTLAQTVPVGVAFHHAGLTTEERDLIADAYDSGVLKVCVATCSLAAGINLPARRVILHNARMGRDLVGPSMLRQMRGRAGRKGKDEVGETYLCCRPSDFEDVVDLMHADLPEISSCLLTDKRRIQRALLEAIAVRLATSRESLADYIEKTLLYHSSGADSIQPMIDLSLDELQTRGFITIGDFSSYEATKLGRAIVASALDPEDGTFIHNELERALKAFVLDGEMHILYTFTPVSDFSIAVDWQVFWTEMEGLDESGLRVLGFLGLKPTVINNMNAPQKASQIRSGWLIDWQASRGHAQGIDTRRKRGCSNLPSVLHGFATPGPMQRSSRAPGCAKVSCAAGIGPDTSSDVPGLCGRHDQVLRANGMEVWPVSLILRWQKAKFAKKGNGGGSRPFLGPPESRGGFGPPRSS